MDRSCPRCKILGGDATTRVCTRICRIQALSPVGRCLFRLLFSSFAENRRSESVALVRLRVYVRTYDIASFRREEDGLLATFHSPRSSFHCTAMRGGIPFPPIPFPSFGFLSSFERRFVFIGASLRTRNENKVSKWETDNGCENIARK